MAAVMMRGVVAVCLVFIVAVSSDVSKRKLKTTFWPQCTHNRSECTKAKEEGKNVVYTKASSPSNDNLYYAFSTIGLPTIVLARATGDADMTFDWTKLINESASIYDAIKIEGKSVSVHYMYGLTFTRLIEYDDKHDDANLIDWEKNRDNNTLFKVREFGKFNWMPLPDHASNNSFVFNTTTDMMEESESHNGSLSFSFTVRGDAGRSSELPSLKYGANDTQFDFVLANYTPSFNHSRFALEAVVVSLSGNKGMSLESTDSIDDEYSPGVFEIVNWLSNPKKEHYAGFFQWKPVCYLSKNKARKSATKVKHYDLEGLTPDGQELVNQSIVAALFGEKLWNEHTVIRKTTNISFGLSKDGFYLKNNYTAWTAAVGYGTPPTDEISTTVIIIISAGLGLPVVIIIFGGIYSIFRRLRNRSQYQPINSGTVR